MSYRDSLIRLLSTVSPLRRVAEIGVHRGRTSAMILERFPGAMLYMVDSWKPYQSVNCFVTCEMVEEFKREALSTTSEFCSRRVVLEMDSVEASAHVPILDAAFIDANHSYQSVKSDVSAWHPKVRGILSGHDYGNPDFPGVKKAVDEFAEENGLTLNITEGNIWWINC